MPELAQILVLDPRGLDAETLRRRALRHRVRHIILACEFDTAADIGLETRRPDGPGAEAVLAALGAGANLVLIDRGAQEDLMAASRDRGLPCTRLFD